MYYSAGAATIWLAHISGAAYTSCMWQDQPKFLSQIALEQTANTYVELSNNQYFFV